MMNHASTLRHSKAHRLAVARLHGKQWVRYTLSIPESFAGAKGYDSLRAAVRLPDGFRCHHLARSGRDATDLYAVEGPRSEALILGTGVKVLSTERIPAPKPIEDTADYLLRRGWRDKFDYFANLR